MVQSGKTLSMHNDSVFKGSFTHNGILQKIHENSYTVGYAALVSPDGESGGNLKFGDGAFFNLNEKGNRIYAGKPTVTGAVAGFAGIVVREPGIASSYPALNDEVNDFQHGKLCVEGFLNYKKGDVYYSATSSNEDVNLYEYAYVNYVMFVSGTDGSAYFTPKSTVFKSANDVMVGRVVRVNPDDKEVTVYVTPALLADTASVAGATPTVEAGTPTQTAIPVTVTTSVPATIKVEYKKNSDSDYTAVDGTFTPTYVSADDNYVASANITGLTAGTAYTIRVTAITVSGAASATATATTAA